MPKNVMNFLHDLALPYRIRLCSLIEASLLWFTRVRTYHRFYVVSSQRNAGNACVECLDSVYEQNHPRDLIRHIFIDDASDDDTPEIIEKWLASHPGHSVDFIRNTVRKGGCFNNISGFRMAPPGAIVCELNGDDWLPDPGVIPYLNRVYQNLDVWMTYNTVKTSKGRLVKPLPIPRDIIESNSFREHAAFGRHLHTFRQELFTHLRQESLIDPDTGEYFISGDDKALYLSLQELAGRHSRHLYRVTYIYNYSGDDPDYGDTDDKESRTGRIYRMPVNEPLEALLDKDPGET